MALQELWIQKRSQRKQLAAQRRQKVNEWRQLTQKELQLQAELLHQQLSSFVTKLREDRKQQQQQFQQEIAQRQLEILHLKTDVWQRQQEYHQQRIAKAQTLFQNLQHFRAQLHASVWKQDNCAPAVLLAAATKEKLVNSCPPADTVKSKLQQYIQQAQGATLLEIEQVMGLNRMQAIDILRTLIKQGVLQQRDRQYFVRQQARS
jgi:hypothetical protein